MKAQLIVIEGLEGAGKSTAIECVQQLLQQVGIDQMIATREPGGTVFAEKIRDIVKATEQAEQLLPESELLLMMAARKQLVEHVIKPALAKGCWVIADRHALSTWAYQGGGRQLPDDMIQAVHHVILAEFKPDFTLYLDVDPSIGLERIGKRGQLDRIEQEDLAFFTRIRSKYLELVHTDDNIVLIDASQPLATVQQAIRAALMAYYPEFS
ncbi:MAG: dTMP kinase [Gammaproteobacteria bacterium]